MSRVSGALLMILGALLAIYGILQFLVAPAMNGIEKARRNETHIYGIPIPPIARALAIIGLIAVVAIGALVFIIGQIYYQSERIFFRARAVEHVLPD